MSASDYGRSLTGLSLNLVVRDVARSVSFYTEVLGFRALYSDADFAALERDGARLTLHADHAYEAVPWTRRLQGVAKRGAGAEIRILGIDPVAAARAARERGHAVPYGPLAKAHGWHEVHLEDPDGYIFAVGLPTPPSESDAGR
jgi:catechol 2,3-dioxygenase-like lactoylglutathione lyase family enzyme